MSERRAWICPNKSHQEDKNAQAPLRIFLADDVPANYVPRCPTHGTAMQRQPNRPYRGKAIVSK